MEMLALPTQGAHRNSRDGVLSSWILGLIAVLQPTIVVLSLASELCLIQV